jgi:DnaJ-class molecular chaperone
MIRCPICKGKGEEWFMDSNGDANHDICSYCDGTGYVKEQKYDDPQEGEEDKIVTT